MARDPDAPWTEEDRLRLALQPRDAHGASFVPVSSMPSASRLLEPADLADDAAVPEQLAEEAASVRRHRGLCSVCRHPDRADIEAEWLAYAADRTLETRYGLPDHSLARHAAALDLHAERAARYGSALAEMLARGLERFDPSSLTVDQLCAIADRLRDLQRLDLLPSRGATGTGRPLPPEAGGATVTRRRRATYEETIMGASTDPGARP